eukprot:TRINITY_DN5382_c0_g1_i1.p1 TRINITY_DN5382_c0_g1~~TRINITY_DN5382_c0_g1_i1.p1  ORF type:complete len:249 (+),score=47.14 TRINITY_DN5382_c0_g1_i1:18-764(+)
MWSEKQSHAFILINNQIKRVFTDIEEGDTHGFTHALAVQSHTNKALELESSLSQHLKFQISLASLLHDVDDHKLFPESQDYENARLILNSIESDLVDVDLVIEMIDLVSTSKNKNHADGIESFKLIPRDSDRLEAIGAIGVIRCYEFSVERDRLLFTEDTQRATDLEGLYRIATPERFAQYQGGSASMIDHYYDKLLHVCHLSTDNEYLVQEADSRRGIMEQVCLLFGREGKIDYDMMMGVIQAPSNQ